MWREFARFQGLGIPLLCIRKPLVWCRQQPNSPSHFPQRANGMYEESGKLESIASRRIF
jgi:hypothetical protein